MRTDDFLQHGLSNRGKGKRQEEERIRAILCCSAYLFWGYLVVVDLWFQWEFKCQTWIMYNLLVDYAKSLDSILLAVLVCGTKLTKTQFFYFETLFPLDVTVKQ